MSASYTLTYALDRAVTLCLACSSSLPPRKAFSASSSSTAAPPDEIFLTRCCGQPICPDCISNNPRLARYYPCLHCLGGAEAVSNRLNLANPATGVDKKSIERNVDGAVKNEDVFAIGDDDDDADGDIEDEDVSPLYQEQFQDTEPDFTSLKRDDPAAVPEQAATCVERSESIDMINASGPPVYYIKPTDTLLGIALKFGLDAHTLCRLNDLPLPAIRTTPHLLHTRAHLTLPLTSRTVGLPKASPPPPPDPTRQRTHAELRFRALTKETDEYVARAYIAVADVHEDEDEEAAKIEGANGKKRARPAIAGERLEDRATERYYDDEEWETQERREGRGVTMPNFPLVSGQSSAELKGRKASKWWQW